MNFLIYGGLLIVGVVLAFFAIQEFNKTQKLLKLGVTTTGKVIDVIIDSSGEGSTYTPVFEYYTSQNEKKTHTSEVGSGSSSSYEIGEKIELIYSEKGDKSVKTISYWGLYRWTVVWLACAAPLLIIGGGYFLYLLKMK